MLPHVAFPVQRDTANSADHEDAVDILCRGGHMRPTVYSAERIPDAFLCYKWVVKVRMRKTFLSISLLILWALTVTPDVLSVNQFTCQIRRWKLMAGYRKLIPWGWHV